MLDDDVVTVPAGWYPDPMGLPQLRWWDNHSWTEFTSAARTPLIMQDQSPLSYADDDLPSRRSQREQRSRDEQFGRQGATETVRQPPLSQAELISTLRQLEPPKAQQVERNQPAPTLAQAEFSQPDFTNEAQDHVQQAQSRHAAQQQPAASVDSDPVSESINPATPEAPRAARSSVSYDEGTPGFPPAPEAGFAPGYESNPQAQYVPQGYSRSEYERPQRRIADASQQIYTPTVWIIAMIPLAQIVAILLCVSSGAESLSSVVPIVIGILPYVAAIVLAFFDRAALLRSGHHEPAHWAWAFLSPVVYLIARSVATNREFGKGMAPTLVWASLTLLQAISVIAVPGIIISVMPGVFTAEAEQSIVADAAIVGTTLDVACPSPAVQIGVQFTCLGTTETGNQVEIKVSLQRANGWIDWRVDSQVWQSGELN